MKLHVECQAELSGVRFNLTLSCVDFTLVNDGSGDWVHQFTHPDNYTYVFTIRADKKTCVINGMTIIGKPSINDCSKDDCSKDDGHVIITKVETLVNK